MSQVRHRPEDEIPPEWFIPDWVVKGWGSTRQANELVAQGIWAEYVGGWRFVWIRPNNTADHLRTQRKRERDKWAQRQAKARNSPGESRQLPLGSYKGELPS